MRVTAVITTYNCSRLLGRAIDSVLGQSRPVDELIVVDDGSSDDTRDVVARYGHAVRYIYQCNAGAAAARNHAIREARSDWIAFLDHDDEWLPTKNEKQVGAIEKKPGAIACYTWLWCVSQSGTQQLARLVQPDQLWPFIRLRNPFVPTVAMIKKQALDEVGGYNERLGASCEDWDLHVRLAARNPMGFIDVQEPLAKWHITGVSPSTRPAMMLTNNLSIVEPTLLIGLDGVERAIWRRRIRSSLFYQAAVGAREYGGASLQYLLQSFLEWPLPTFEPRRLKTLAVHLLERLSWYRRFRERRQHKCRE